MSDATLDRRTVERHYDSLSLLYRLFWGEHIHHGLWQDPSDAPRRAQERLVEHLASRAEVERGSRVLDIGCGYGASARWLARHLGCDVVGITPSACQARIARRRNRRAGVDRRLQVVRADAARLPFPQGRYDVVWMIECLEHLHDKTAFVRDVGRLLKPRGRFALCVWLRGEPPAGDLPLVDEVCTAFLCPSLPSVSECREWCRRAGLELTVEEDLTGRVRRTWDVVMKRLARPWWAPVRGIVGSEVRSFMAGFPKIAAAFATGAMRYGMLVARRPSRTTGGRPGTPTTSTTT